MYDVRIISNIFKQQVEAIRSDELSTMRQRVKYSVFMTFVWTCTPIMVSSNMRSNMRSNTCSNTHRHELVRMDLLVLQS